MAAMNALNMLTNGGPNGNIIVGEPLVSDSGELNVLVDAVLTGKLRAKTVDVQADGDTRYWGVDVSQSIVLQRLKEFGEMLFIKETGEPPASSFVMVNYVDPQKCPTGSGGGWHRDSLRPQYKAFTYLTSVENESQGAFCFIPASNSLPFRLASTAHRLLSGRNRYSDRAINAVIRSGFSRFPLLLKAGVPFFANTSLIHRGLPIRQGHRIAATLYMMKATDDVGEYASYETKS